MGWKKYLQESWPSKNSLFAIENAFIVMSFNFSVFTIFNSPETSCLCLNLLSSSDVFLLTVKILTGV